MRLWWARFRDSRTARQPDGRKTRQVQAGWRPRRPALIKEADRPSLCLDLVFDTA